MTKAVDRNTIRILVIRRLIMYSLHYILMKAHINMHRSLSGRAAASVLTSGKPKVLECLADFREANQKSIVQYCKIEQATV